MKKYQTVTLKHTLRQTVDIKSPVSFAIEGPAEEGEFVYSQNYSSFHTGNTIVSYTTSSIHLDSGCYVCHTFIIVLFKLFYTANTYFFSLQPFVNIISLWKPCIKYFRKTQFLYCNN